LALSKIKIFKFLGLKKVLRLFWS